MSNLICVEGQKWHIVNYLETFWFVIWSRLISLVISFFITCPPISTWRIFTACGLVVLLTNFSQLFVSWDASNQPRTPLPAMRTWNTHKHACFLMQILDYKAILFFCKVFCRDRCWSSISCRTRAIRSRRNKVIQAIKLFFQRNSVSARARNDTHISGGETATFRIRNIAFNGLSLTKHRPLITLLHLL